MFGNIIMEAFISQKLCKIHSGTPPNFTTFFTTFAGNNMPRYASICQDMPFYPYLVSAVRVD